MNLRGAHTAIITPFTTQGEINWNSLERFLDFQIRNGISGIVPCGTTGESPTLSKSEKLDLIAFVQKHCSQRCKVIAGTGSNNTSQTIELSKTVIELGVDVLMVITPYYNKPGQEGLYRHFAEIAREIEGFPMIIYNVPSRTNVHIEAETVMRLHSEYPNIIGIKDASGDFDHLLKIKSMLPSTFNLLCGEDGLLLPYLACGASGVVSVASNVIPHAMQNFCNWETKEDLHHSLDKQLKYRTLIDGLFLETNPIPVKYMLNKMGLDAGIPRLPLHEATENCKVLLDQLTHQFNLSLS